MTEWPAKRVRDTFVDYFVSKGHKHVVSSPVVPLNDHTILFANAGACPAVLQTHQRPTPSAGACMPGRKRRRARARRPCAWLAAHRQSAVLLC